MSISYNLRTYVHNLNGSVMIRVRWEHKTRTVVFACGVFAEKNKWDEDQQKAQKNTVHSIGGHEYSARQINSAVAEMKEIISDAFSSYDGAASPIYCFPFHGRLKLSNMGRLYMRLQHTTYRIHWKKYMLKNSWVTVIGIPVIRIQR